MPGKTNILSINRAYVGFKKKNEEIRLLENVNLKIKTGELTGLIGRNGAGKSTLLRCIVRLQDLLNGSIKINKDDILDIHPNVFAQLLAYVSSGLEHTETMTVKELVSLGRFPYSNWIGRLLPADIELIDESMERVGIEHLSKRKLTEISDGERQKAMIARTLAQNTPIIVMDEPTAFLDLPSKYDIISLLYELSRKGKTIIYSTHDLNISLRFSDKIWLIDDKTIHVGSPEDLILDKTIAGIFDSDKIHLNEMTGDFELRKNFTKKLCFKCEIPDLFYWTQHAIQRSGYEIVEFDKDLPQVSVEMKDNKIFWKIQRFNENLVFDSIYDLLSEL
jgi:iron complex transport system ATP-binding protein